MQALQLATSRGRVQAEDRSKVSRFPLWPHYSRFEQALLLLLSQGLSDGRRLAQGAYIVSNT